MKFAPSVFILSAAVSHFSEFLPTASEPHLPPFTRSSAHSGAVLGTPEGTTNNLQLLQMFRTFLSRYHASRTHNRALLSRQGRTFAACGLACAPLYCVHGYMAPPGTNWGNVLLLSCISHHNKIKCDAEEAVLVPIAWRLCCSQAWTPARLPSYNCKCISRKYGVRFSVAREILLVSFVDFHAKSCFFSMCVTSSSRCSVLTC